MLFSVCQFLIANSAYVCFFSEKPICSSSRYYSVSARIRTWRRPLISSIKQRKRGNIVGLQFRFAVPLSWHEVRPLGGRRLRKHGASFISPTNLLSRTDVARTGHKNSASCPLNTNKMFAPGGIDNGS